MIDMQLNKALQLSLIEESLAAIGFAILESKADAAQGRYWFCAPTGGDGTKTFLRFVRKPGFKILTAHVGWQNPFVRQFVIDSMKRSWPAGLHWMSENKLIEEPCLLTFNFGDQPSWPLSGIPFNCSEQEFAGHTQELRDLLQKLIVPISTADVLLERYLADVKPLRWLGGNTAIRFAEAAGLVKLVGKNADELKRCAQKYAPLIETHMFGLGSGSDWTKALLEQL